MSFFRPCIDLHDGRVKQIVGSTLSERSEGLKTNFVSGHPASYFAELYCADNLTGGHVIKLGPGNDEAAKEALRAWPGNLQLGGGVTAENAGAWLDAGAAQVIVTSYIFSDGILQEDNLKKLVKAVGCNHLVLDLSCRKTPDGEYRIVTDRWQKFTRLAVNARTLEMLSGNCCEFLIHAVDVEGKQSGIDRELLSLLAENSPIHCVYAGGIRNFSDIDEVLTAGRKRISFTIGSALDIFGGPLSYREVVNRLQDQSPVR